MVLVHRDELVQQVRSPCTCLFGTVGCDRLSRPRCLDNVEGAYAENRGGRAWEISPLVELSQHSYVARNVLSKRGVGRGNAFESTRSWASITLDDTKKHIRVIMFWDLKKIVHGCGIV